MHKYELFYRLKEHKLQVLLSVKGKNKQKNIRINLWKKNETFREKKSKQTLSYHHNFVDR
jgi:hypothetical protein